MSDTNMLSVNPRTMSRGIRTGLKRTKPESRKSPTCSESGFLRSRIRPTIHTAANIAMVEEIISTKDISPI